MAQLSPLLVLEGMTFVPLRRLGQDHVESLFCCVVEMVSTAVQSILPFDQLFVLALSRAC